MMYPWLGGPNQLPGMPLGAGFSGLDPRVLQILQQQRLQGGGGPFGAGGGGGGGNTFDLSRFPQMFQQIGTQFPQFGQAMSRFTDNGGLSSLWSTQVGQPTAGPMGWNTAVNSARSPIGGLLGRIGSLF